MKLTLGQQEGIAILEVKGAVDSHNFQVLKAGLSKLLRDGRNRIVLSFEECENLEADVIREVAILDVFARELAGQIVISSSNEKLKESVLNFSKPPVIPFLTSVSQAVDFFQKQRPETEDAVEDAAELKKIIEAKDKEIEALKAKLQLLDPSELKRVRADKAEAEARAGMLEEQLEALLAQRKAPIDASGFIAKIEALEETVKKLTAAQPKG